MLKDITLGQFFPGNSYLHRLDPRIKIISVLLFIADYFCKSPTASVGAWVMWEMKHQQNGTEP